MSQFNAWLNATQPFSPVASTAFQKGEYLLKEGQKFRHLFFVTKGLFQIYHYRGNRIVTSRLLKEGDILISILINYSQVSSFENIVALEDSECQCVPFQESKHACENMIVASLCKEAKRVHEMQDASAAEKYAMLVKNEPELPERVPQYILAGYLNISDRWYRRVRDAYIRKN